MDVSEARSFVGSEVGRLAEMLGIPHWRLTVEYGPIDADATEGFSARGRCRVHACYNRAIITIDAQQVDDEEELFEVLLHELCHVLLTPFDVYRTIYGRDHDKGGEKGANERAAWTYAAEQGVINLERMFRGVGEAAREAARRGGKPPGGPAPPPKKKGR